MRADRLLSMLMLLQTKGRMTAESLAERLEVSTRTIYRDLDALSIAGVPVYSERGPNGGIALLENYRTNLTGLTKHEVEALFMFTVPDLFADLKADKTQQAASLKLLASLPSPFRQDAELARQRIYLDPTAWFRPAEPVPHLPLIQKAVWQNCRLRLTYCRSDGRWVKRLVNPYGLVAKTNVWYMVAAVLGGIAAYRVSRIQEAAMTGSHFERPEKFDLVAYWTEWCAQFEANCTQYDVTLRVGPEGLPLLVQTFGDGIRSLIEQADPPDVDGRLTLSLTLESMAVACQQLLGLGTLVEVLSPQALRDRMLDTARQLAAFYTKPSSNEISSYAVDHSNVISNEE